MSQLLTIQEVAKKCKVTYRTVQRWMDAGKIVFIKLPGGTVRMKEEHLDNWLKYHMVDKSKT